MRAVRSRSRAHKKHQTAHVAPACAPSRAVLHAVCLLPRLCSVRWSATPPGTAHGTRMCRRGGAPIRSAPARHAVRPLRSRPASRARPSQTGGDPAAPGWHRARLNPAQPGRASAPRAAPGSACPLAGRKRPVSSSGSPSFVGLRGAAWPPAARNRWARPDGIGAFGRPRFRLGSNARQGREGGQASTDAAAIAPPPSRLRAAVADRSCGRSDARALGQLRPLARSARRVAPYRLRLAASSALLRRSDRRREPPGALGNTERVRPLFVGFRFRSQRREAICVESKRVKITNKQRPGPICVG